jgi:hypothetical protein
VKAVDDLPPEVAVAAEAEALGIAADHGFEPGRRGTEDPALGLRLDPGDA